MHSLKIDINMQTKGPLANPTMTNHLTHCQNALQEQEQEPLQPVVVVMVPFPAQGHLNQLLHLSRLISAYNIPVHFAGTTTHNHQATLRVQGWDPLSISNIHFHEFPTPHFLSPPPNPNSTIKFPSHLQPSFEASSQLRDPMGKLLAKLSVKTQRLVVIHDSLMGSVVQDFLSLPNAESYTFHSISAFAIFLFLWENMGRPFQDELPQIVLEDIPTLDGCFTSEFKILITKEHEYTKHNSGRIYNTCRIMESPFLDLLAKEEISKRKKLWALGPFNPVKMNPESRQLVAASQARPEEKLVRVHKCLQWLDKQEFGSVLYVSFGTTTSLSDEQIKELAIGLEKSHQKFIWVLREADKGDVFRKDEMKLELPKGYEERLKGRAMVVREWAPQLEILGHPSTGGFMSHCGWNSCMESISMGVPIAAWPMHSDQPRNATLISKVLKVGLVVREWAHREELVAALVVEEAVRRLMLSGEAEEMRKRAVKMGGDVKMAVEEGGVTRVELDSFIAHITR